MFVVFLDHYTVTIAIMKIFTTLLFVLTLGVSFAQQNTFQITQKGSAYSEQELKDAMNSANWCGYYYEDQRHLLNFDDGSVVELLSYRELISNKSMIDPSCVEGYQSEDKATYILKDGAIVRTAMKPLKIRVAIDK